MFQELASALEQKSLESNASPTMLIGGFGNLRIDLIKRQLDCIFGLSYTEKVVIPLKIVTML